MPKINLRAPFWTEDGKLYRPGRNVEVPQAVADALAPKDAASTGTDEDPTRGPGIGGGGGKEGDAAWPDGFPSADLLQAAGVKSAAAAQGMSREALIELGGIGPARADAVLAWKPE